MLEIKTVTNGSDGVVLFMSSLVGIPQTAAKAESAERLALG
jgi:hypothetical protein